MKKNLLLNSITFLSAFLLFQIELIVAKILLPNYGGSYMVWGSCMVFFQAVLLLGYLFSHVVISRIGMSKYRLVHLVLMAIPFLLFPGKTLTIAMPTPGVPLAFDVFWQLLVTIGPVFFTLSTIGVSSQMWLSRSDLPERVNPYPLYSWSNLGSFLGLFTYPFIFESAFTVSQQLLIWRNAYLFLVILSLVSYWVIRVIPQKEKGVWPSAVPQADMAQWLLLSAGAVMMFLSTTNIMTMEIAPVPILWTIPLGIYLLAFVLNFQRHPWCPAWIIKNIHFAIGFGILFFFFPQQHSFPILLQLIVTNFLLFMYMMFCQRRLAELRPRHDEHLTFFYLLIAFGGFVGGLLTSWIIPLVSVSPVEYLVGLAVISLVLPGGEEPNRARVLRFLFYFVVMIFAWPMIFTQYNVWGILAILSFFYIAFRFFNQYKRVVTLAVLVVLILAPYLEMAWANKVFIYRKRNFYGIYKIYREPGFITLYHGTIIHGSQFRDPALQKVPTTYFGESSPAGKLLTAPQFNFKQVGIIGLGTGTLSAYVDKGQSLDFYELDPDVLDISRQYFSYTKKSAASIRYFIGDARRELVKNTQAKYDLFIVDAFAGDSVPVHLLTREMMELYRARLTQNGILLVHVSNRYLKLGKIVELAAAASGAQAAYQMSKEVKWWEAGSEWVAITWNRDVFAQLQASATWEQRPVDARTPVWTDEYSNIVGLFRPEYLVGTFKNFTPFNW